MATSLLRAVRDNDRGRLASLLNNLHTHNLVNSSIPHNQYGHTTCLYEACQLGYKGVVKQLLYKKGINVNKGSSLDQRTPLHAAAENGHFSIVKLLLRHGAEIKADINGYTPIHLAAEKEFVGVLCWLFEKGGGADYINCKSCGIPGGYTALHEAVCAGKTLSVRLLLDWSADINIRTDSDKTAMDLADELEDNHIAMVLKDADNSASVSQRSSMLKNMTLFGTDLKLISQRLKIIEDKQDVTVTVGDLNQLADQVNRLEGQQENIVERMERMEQTLNKSNQSECFAKRKMAESINVTTAPVIRKNYEYIIHNILADEHLDFLFQEYVLTEEDLDVIRAEAGDVRKSRELLRILFKKKQQWEPVFMESLKRKGVSLPK